MKVSKHNYIPDIKFHSGIHCDDYLIFKWFGLTVFLCKMVEKLRLTLKF